MANRYDENTFLAYVEGTLPIAERVAFEKYMVDDPRLRNLVAQLVLDRHRLRQLPAEEPPAGLMDGIDLHVERTMLLDTAAPVEAYAASTRSVTLRRVGVYAALAAMVALSALLIFNAISPEHRFNPEQFAIQPPQDPDDGEQPAISVRPEVKNPDTIDDPADAPATEGTAPTTHLAMETAPPPAAEHIPDRGLRLDFGHFAWTAWPSLMPAADARAPIRLEIASTQPLQTQQRFMSWTRQHQLVAVADQNDPLQVLARKADEARDGNSPKVVPNNVAHATFDPVIEVFTVEKSATGLVTLILPAEDVERLLIHLNQPSYQTARLMQDWSAQLAMWRATAPRQVMRIPVVIRPATAATLQRIVGNKPASTGTTHTAQPPSD